MFWLLLVHNKPFQNLVALKWQKLFTTIDSVRGQWKRLVSAADSVGRGSSIGMEDSFSRWLIELEAEQELCAWVLSRDYLFSKANILRGNLEVHGIFILQPQKAHRVTFAIFCWSRQSQNSVQFHGEETNPHNSMGSVKVTLQEYMEWEILFWLSVENSLPHYTYLEILYYITLVQIVHSEIFCSPFFNPDGYPLNCMKSPLMAQHLQFEKYYLVQL